MSSSRSQNRTQWRRDSSGRLTRGDVDASNSREERDRSRSRDRNGSQPPSRNNTVPQRRSNARNNRSNTSNRSRNRRRAAPSASASSSTSSSVAPRRSARIAAIQQQPRSNHNHRNHGRRQQIDLTVDTSPAPPPLEAASSSSSSSNQSGNAPQRPQPITVQRRQRNRARGARSNPSADVLRAFARRQGRSYRVGGSANDGRFAIRHTVEIRMNMDANHNRHPQPIEADGDDMDDDDLGFLEMNDGDSDDGFFDVDDDEDDEIEILGDNMRGLPQFEFMDLHHSHRIHEMHENMMLDFILARIGGHNMDDMGFAEYGQEYGMSAAERELFINGLPVRTLTVQDIQAQTCRICLNQYAVGDKVTTLPCFHQFHSECVNPWFQTKLNCPTCRHSIRNNEMHGDEEEEEE